VYESTSVVELGSKVEGTIYFMRDVGLKEEKFSSVYLMLTLTVN